MDSGNAAFLVAAVTIFAIIAFVVVYAIKRLAGQPMRIAATIVALATLVGAMVPLVDELHTMPSAPPPRPVSPASGVGR
ncbi:hypothetical protein AB0H73_16000 [Streptomyces olivoreticuli]|uniref:hypothetical protein n=1 Tax=Streptomyces olivoreticuli TaxID=68246 RepID=UPI0013C29FCD|nr:hypothetical protein [Streptomyces olivoreticuli]